MSFLALGPPHAAAGWMAGQAQVEAPGAYIWNLLGQLRDRRAKGMWEGYHLHWLHPNLSAGGLHPQWSPGHP